VTSSDLVIGQEVFDRNCSVISGILANQRQVPVIRLKNSTSVGW